MFNDKPITDISQDVLNRKIVIDEIINEIDNAGTDCFIIGMCGKWGSGKTSLMNLVLSNLPSKSFHSIKFNPWMMKDNVDIIQRFFRILETEMDQKGPITRYKLKKVAKCITRDALGKYSSWPALLIRAYYETISSNDTIDTLQRLKGAISDSLKKTNKKYVISIDDIDRMDKEEIIQLFKFIRNVTDFDNIVYLLAYDDTIVSKALNTDAYSGHEYLQKIVDLPITIPDTSRDLIETVLRRDFESITGIPVFSKAQMQTENYPFDEMKHIFPAIITTIREEKRLMSVFKNKYSLSKKDTYCYDLLSLCTLELKRPELISWIRSNSDMLCPLIDGYEDYERSTKTIRRSFSELKLDKPLKNLLENMFPVLYKDNCFDWISPADPELNKRMCHPLFFDNYFIQVPDNIHLSEMEIERIISLNSAKEIETIICKYIHENDVLFDRLYAYQLIHLDKTLPTIIRFLLCDKNLINRPRKFNPRIHAKASRFVDQYCLVNSIDKTDFYIAAINQINIDSLFRFLIILAQTQLMRGGAKSTENSKRIADSIVSFVESHYKEYTNPLKDPEYYAMVSFLYRYLNKPDLCRTIHNHFIQTEKDIDMFLDTINKLYSISDKDLTVLLVNPDLIKTSNYQEKYNKRYWD